MKNTVTLFYWLSRLIAAGLLLQTLFFKFSGAEESVKIFTQVGMEPWGRIGTGILELIATVLLLINRTAWMGAVIAVGLMAGAIGMHVLILGIVRDDGGQLFFYAVAVFVCSSFVLFKNRNNILSHIHVFTGKAC